MRLTTAFAAIAALHLTAQVLGQQSSTSDCTAPEGPATITATITVTVLALSSNIASTETTTTTVFDTVTTFGSASTITLIGEASTASNDTTSVPAVTGTANSTADLATGNPIQNKPSTASIQLGGNGWNTTTANLSAPISASHQAGIFGRAARVDTDTIAPFTETGVGPRPPVISGFPPGTLPLIPPYPITSTTFLTRILTEGTATGTGTGTGTASPKADCGESGDFRLGFDDLPALVTNTTDITQAAPIFSPYHHLQFSEGFVYAPLPEAPFRAVTPPHLAVFITNKTGASNTPSTGLIRPGEIGAGQRASTQAYWFNAYAVYLGCDNRDAPGCVYEITGYTWDRSSRAEVASYRDNITTPACPILKDCPLTFIDLPPNMRSLSGLQIRAFVGEEQRIWFMDELALGWWDDSCEAARVRAASRKRA